MIKVSVKKADYQQGVNQRIKNYSKTANIKGFRTGKVPPGMIRSLYGKTIIYEEVDKLVSDKLSTYLRESDLQFLGEPVPEQIDETHDWVHRETIEFNYHVGFALPFEVKVDKTVKVNKYSITIDDRVINETIENLQRRFGVRDEADVSSEGDKLHGKVQTSAGTVDREIVIDLRHLEKTSLKNFVGLKIGDTARIDPKKTFKDNNDLKYWLQMDDKEYDALEGTLDFTLEAVTHYEPAEVNEALFNKVFDEGNVKTEEAFRAGIREEVSKNYERESDRFFENQLRDMLVAQATIELPDAFLKSWLIRTNEQFTGESIDRDYPWYANELKWTLLIDKIAKDRKIGVVHEEVFHKAKELVGTTFSSDGLEESQIDDRSSTLAHRYLQEEKGENYTKVFNQLKNTKVLDYIKAEISVENKEVSRDEFRTL